MLPILKEVGDLRMLLKPDIAERVDATCLAQLDLMLKSEYCYFPGESKSRPPKSIEEGCLIGSPVAQTLAVLRVIRSEKKRLEKLAAKARKKSALQAQIRKL